MAGTPSSYTNILVFPKNWKSGIRKVFALPLESILGFYSFASAEVVQTTFAGANYAGGPSLGFDENAARLPELWEPCERRILKLPAGMTEADTAL